MKESKKLSTLDKYVMFSISILLLYAIVELIVSSITGQNHDTLTTCIYTAFGGEILSCALIKVFKLKEADHEEEVTEP